MRLCTPLPALAFMTLLGACGGPTPDPLPSTPPTLDMSPTARPDPPLIGDPVQAAAPSIEVFNYAPPWLSRTGLYSSPDLRTPTLADGVMPFQPQYELWADGSGKQRYVFLPPGGKIDSGNMDRWRYPIGTKLWKEFRAGGKRIETRMEWKRGDKSVQDSGWVLVTYRWLDDESDAALNLVGVPNARGSGHDIPPQMDCESCHRKVYERPLGFSAIQLAGTATGVNLKYLTDHGLLTAPPPPAGFPIPGGVAIRQGLGYLHANCGGCHAADSDVQNTINMVLRLEVGKLATVQQTPMYLTTVNQLTMSTKGGTDGQPRVVRGDPAGSAVYKRMGVREVSPESLQMPPQGSNLVDDAGRAIVANLIQALP